MNKEEVTALAVIDDEMIIEETDRLKKLKRAKDMLEGLSPIHKKIFSLYECIVTEKMTTHEYKESLKSQIEKCKSFDKANKLRTKECAIKEYEREVIAMEFGKNDVIRDKDGVIDVELYDSLLEIEDDGNSKSRVI